jgi:hypothetical protein
MSEQDMPTTGEQDIQPFEVTDAEMSFPAGKYLFVIGKIKAMYSKEGDSTEPEAVTNDLWVVKYIGGTDNNAKPHMRITFKDGVPTLHGIKGVKLVERYPNPKIMPKMSWRASAFYSKFPNAIEEITLASFDAEGNPKKKKVVVWKNIQAMYGLVFEASLVYKPNKDKSRTYRNFDYPTIVPSDNKIPADDMRKIEELYDALKKQDEAPSTSAPSAEDSLKDLPF